MTYVIWMGIGLLVAFIIGAGPRRRAYRPNANGALFAGVFGALVGGVIGDGVQRAWAGQLTLLSVVGAVVGSVVLCWAVRDRASDLES